MGTVRDLAKQDGTIAVHYKYDSYGNVTSGDTSKSRYLFTGREFDTATDLQYNRARWYDAEVGRWISEDPLGFAAGDANIGRYVGNRVIISRDSSGMQNQDDVRRLLRSLGMPNEQPDDNRNAADIGQIIIALPGKSPYPAKIIEIGDTHIKIGYTWEGKPMTAELPIDGLSGNDQNMVKDLKLMPTNVTIDTEGSNPKAADKFVRGVIADFGKLAGLPTGAQLIKDIGNVARPLPQKLRGSTFTPRGNLTPIKIVPSTDLVNGKSDSKTIIKYDPRTGNLYPDFAPTVHYNPGSGFAGLGKELWHAWQQIAGAIIPNAKQVEWDLRALKIKEALLREDKR